jgi:hypothetical protein
MRDWRCLIVPYAPSFPRNRATSWRPSVRKLQEHKPNASTGNGKNLPVLQYKSISSSSRLFPQKHVPRSTFLRLCVSRLANNFRTSWNRSPRFVGFVEERSVVPG